MGGVPLTDVGNKQQIWLREELFGKCWMWGILCVDLFSVHLGKYLGAELLGHSNSILNFLKSARLFSKVAAPFYFPTGNVWGFQFFTSSPTPVIVHPFEYSPPSGLWRSFYNKKQQLEQYCGQAHSLINQRTQSTTGSRLGGKTDTTSISVPGVPCLTVRGSGCHCPGDQLEMQSFRLYPTRPSESETLGSRWFQWSHPSMSALTTLLGMINMHQIHHLLQMMMVSKERAFWSFNHTTQVKGFDTFQSWVTVLM